jgi:hypothetical protein
MDPASNIEERPLNQLTVPPTVIPFYAFSNKLSGPWSLTVADRLPPFALELPALVGGLGRPVAEDRSVSSWFRHLPMNSATVTSPRL